MFIIYCGVCGGNAWPYKQEDITGMGRSFSNILIYHELVQVTLSNSLSLIKSQLAHLLGKHGNILRFPIFYGLLLLKNPLLTVVPAVSFSHNNGNAIPSHIYGCICTYTREDCTRVCSRLHRMKSKFQTRGD